MSKYKVDDLVKWFFQNYKNPADGVYYDKREGGYQYLNGGPYDAEEVLVEKYPDVDEDTLNKAVSNIEAQGYEWVGIDEY
ncbi:MAG: hypothetical protein LBM87_01200 [Ruminococcus sp.]|jgi:hypothetical protein|nr:hypothetical protein [Ruminococcus sp.]